MISFENKVRHKKEEKMLFLKRGFQKLSFQFFCPLRSEKGQTMIEYAMVAVLIAIVLVFLFNLSGVRSGVSGAGSKVGSSLK